MIDTTIDSNAPRRQEGDYSPRPHCAAVHELDGGCISTYFKVAYLYVNYRDGTKFPVSTSAEPKKHHPRLRLSDRQRWAVGDPGILLHLQPGEAVLFFYVATISSRPMQPLIFFTIALPADLTGAECGLVHYFC
jgi:hypothetical protein